MADTRHVRRLSPEEMRDAAEIAAETGVCVTIERAGRVYRFEPSGPSLPIGASESDRARCDAAFGVSG